LLVHRLLARPPKQQLAPAPERQIYQLWKARFALRATAAALVVGALLMSARQLAQWQELRQETDTLEAKTTVDSMRYNAILDGLPKTQLTPDTLRAVIANYDELQRRSPAIEPLLQHLGQALLDTPGIDLQRIEWAISDKPDAPIKVGAGVTAPLAAGSAPAAIWTVLEVKAELPRSLANDQRAQVDRVERLAVRLRSNGIDVSIQSLPIDIESAKPMKSRPDEAVTGSGLAPAPRFTLRLKKALSS
jgi:hypothetical protein